ncbi:type II toxin-antitoxin system VapC family toxin [Deinococcus aluminii]|uniref:PIN domain-containing protein n=1 Tax=Deinococcus aluminii TaxID=1656885 RepID=A0ABP9XDT1_9DEIO
MRYALDSDVLIYAADLGNPLGGVIRHLLQPSAPGTHLGSVLLFPEVLARPLREGKLSELKFLSDLLATLELQEITAATAQLSTQLAAAYRLKAADALHLATAVQAGADAFVTNNRKDFKPSEVLEIRVLFPEEVG